MTSYSHLEWSRVWTLGHVIHLKPAAIEAAQDRATIRLGIYTLIANI